jgi:hypothetical protein
MHPQKVIQLATVLCSFAAFGNAAPTQAGSLVAREEYVPPANYTPVVKTPPKEPEYKPAYKPKEPEYKPAYKPKQPEYKPAYKPKHDDYKPVYKPKHDDYKPVYKPKHDDHYKPKKDDHYKPAPKPVYKPKHDDYKPAPRPQKPTYKPKWVEPAHANEYDWDWEDNQWCFKPKGYWAARKNHGKFDYNHNGKYEHQFDYTPEKKPVYNPQELEKEYEAKKKATDYKPKPKAY